MPQRSNKPNAGMLQSGARILLVPSWLIALALTFKGYVDVGDGFSGGVVASLAVLLQGLAFGADELDRLWASRLAPYATFVGLALAILTAFVPVLFGGSIFLHWPGIRADVGHFGVLEFITPVLFDVGVFLIVYGFCVGGVHAIAREEARNATIRRRAQLPRPGQARESLAEDAGEGAS